MFEKTKRVAKNAIASFKRKQLDKGYKKYKKSTKDSDFEIQRAKSDMESGKGEMSNRAANAGDRLKAMSDGTSPLGRSRKIASDKLQKNINKYGVKTPSRPKTVKPEIKLPGRTGRVVGIPKGTKKDQITRSVMNEARKRITKSKIGK